MSQETDIHEPTLVEAAKSALEFLEALGYSHGDIHDDLAQAIKKVEGKATYVKQIDAGEFHSTREARRLEQTGHHLEP